MALSLGWPPSVGHVLDSLSQAGLDGRRVWLHEVEEPLGQHLGYAAHPASGVAQGKEDLGMVLN